MVSLSTRPMKLLDIDDSLHVEELLKEKKLSSNHIYNSQNANSSSTYFNLIVWFVVLLNLVVLLNIIKLQKDTNSLEVQKTMFVEKHNLPSTSFQIKSITDELALVEKNQIGFREAIFYINKFRVLKDEFYNLIYFKNNIIVFSVELKSKKREKILKQYISKKFTILKSKKNKRSLIVEIQL